MDGGGKKIESICKYVPSIMAQTYTETEKYKISEAYHKVNKANIGSNTYVDDAIETILSI